MDFDYIKWIHIRIYQQGIKYVIKVLKKFKISKKLNILLNKLVQLKITNYQKNI